MSTLEFAVRHALSLVATISTGSTLQPPMYFEKNLTDVYCRVNATPKVEKVREKFAEKVKGEA